MNDKATKTTETTSDEIAEYLKLAKAAQAKKREQAPELTLKEATEIPQKAKIKLYCPEAVVTSEEAKKGKRPKYHAMFGDNKLLRQYAQEGYEIVTDHGQMVTHGDSGDVLVKIPTDLHDRMLQIPVLKDKRMQDAHRHDEAVAISKNPAAGGEQVVVAKPGEPVYDSKSEQV